MKSIELRITEIFYSLQGESTFSGLATVFIRLTGCPLRCGYCDTAYAFQGGTIMTLESIVEQAEIYNTQYVCVTGGEPLAQGQCPQLLEDLCDQGFSVSLETSGALPIEEIDSRVTIVMDIKTPASGEESKNLWTNIEFLKSCDQLKFVIVDRDDYLWACEKIKQYKLAEKVSAVLFSPCAGSLDSACLAEWILEDRLPVRFQIQLHKILWGDRSGV